MQLQTSACNCRVVGTFLEAILWKTFQLCLAFFMMSAASQKHCPFNADFSWRNRWTTAVARPRGSGDAPLLSHCTLLRNPWPKPTTVLEHCCEGEMSCLVRHFLGVFHSDCIHKAMKNVNVHSFIHSSNSCKLYQWIPVSYASEFQELFEAVTYKFMISYGFKEILFLKSHVHLSLCVDPEF